MNSNLRFIVVSSFAALLFTTLRLSATASAITSMFAGDSGTASAAVYRGASVRSENPMRAADASLANGTASFFAAATVSASGASSSSSEASATPLTTASNSITWGPAANMVGDTDVSSAGNYVDAITFYSSPLTVGGVLFNSLGSGENPRTDGTISVSYEDNVADYTEPFSTGAPSSVTYSDLVNTGAYGESSGTVTLSNLTVGHTYQIQSWSYFSFDGVGATTYSGVAPVTLDNKTGQFSIGTFTATTTSVSYSYSTTQGYHNFVNAISLRDITGGGAPVVPVNLQSAVGNKLVLLSWSSASGATSYNLYRSTSPGGEGSSPFATGVGALFYADSQVNNGATYYYTVAGVNNYGASAQSSEVTAVPGSTAAMRIAWGPAKNMVGDTDVLTTGASFDAISFYASPVTVNGVLFNPMSPTGNIHSDGKIVITNGNSVGAYGVAFSTASPSSYYYSEITDAGAFGGGIDTIVLMNLNVGDTYQVQSWSYYSNDGTATTTYSGATPVSLVNSTGQYAIGTFTATSTSEYYNYSASGGHDFVNAISVRDIGSPGPAAPTGLNATAGNAQVVLTWNASSGATSYNIYRGLTAGGESATAIATGITATSATDANVANNTTYYYEVKAVSSSGVSAYSIEVSAKPSLPTYTQWANTYFLSDPANGGEGATPENDGVTNLLKYLCGINPTLSMSVSDRAALPSLGTTILSGSSYLTLTYRQNLSETGLTINVQTSSDLQTWQTVTPSHTLNVGTDPATGDPLIQYQVLVNPTAAAKGFIRLNVIGP